MPEVSIIIPNYNHAPFLKDRIDSVLEQTFQDIEVIILDDNSPDNSRDIINFYRDHPKVKHIIFNDKNSGSTFKQWEKGIGLATGKYIWIAESDDKASPDLLESLMPGFYQNENVCVSFCESYWIDPNNNEVRNIKMDTPSFFMNGKEFIKKYMVSRCRIYNLSMAVIKKETFLNAVSQDYKQFRLCGDYFMWVELLMAGDVFYLNKKLNYFRRHSNTVSYKSEKEGLKFTEGMKVLNLINQNIKLNKKEITATTFYLSNQLAHQYIVLKSISKTNCRYVYSQLKEFCSLTAWIFPIYILKKVFFYPLYAIKKSVKK